MSSKRTIIVTLFVVLLLLLVGCSSGSPTTGDSGSDSLEFPKKEVRIIVPFAPGGGNDIIARIIADVAGKDYLDGQSVIVENKDGGGGSIGQTYVANAKPDGYTLLMCTTSVISNPLLKDVNFSHKDFAPIAMVCFENDVLIVPADSPFDTVAEFIEYAGENKVNITTDGYATSHHMIAEVINEELDLNFNFIHAESFNMLMSQVMGGHTDGSFVPLGDASQYILDGNVKAIGIMADERNATIPNVPTFKESGYDYIDGPIRGLAAPVDTPKEIIAYLEERFGQIIKSAEFVEGMEKANLSIHYMDAAGFKAQMEQTASGIEKAVELLDSKK